MDGVKAQGLTQLYKKLLLGDLWTHWSNTC